MNYKLTDFNHSSPIQVRFNDIDRLGHVNNSIIMQYFDVGRLAYLNEALKEELGKNGKNVVIVSYKTDFYMQVLMHYKLKVHTSVYKIGNKSIRMFQWLVNEGDQTPLATSDSVLSGINIYNDNSIRIPDKWRELFNLMEKNKLIEDINR